MGSSIKDIKFPKIKTTYVDDINDSLDAISAHDHETDEGLPIKRFHADVAGSGFDVTANVLSLHATPAEIVTKAKLHAEAADQSSIELDATDGLRCKTSGVTIDKRRRTFTNDGSDPGVGGVSRSTAQSFFSTTSASFVDITDLDCTLTVTGNPVIVMLAPSGGSISYVRGTRAGGTILPAIKFKRDSTSIYQQDLSCYQNGSGLLYTRYSLPPTAFMYIDNNASAGTYTFQAQINANSGVTAAVGNIKLVVFELL